MGLLLQFLSFFVLLSLSHSESDGGPRDSVCDSDNKGFLPTRGHGPRPVLDEVKYKVTISLVKVRNGQTATCVEDKTRYRVIINATERFKGFIITSTELGVGYPANFVGKFSKGVLDYSDENLILPCDNTVSHSDILKNNPVTLEWRSGNKDVEFLYAIVFSRYIWLANQTAVFQRCTKKPRGCIEPVLPESSGDEPSKATTEVAIGSALSDSSQCKPVKTPLEPWDLYIPISGNMIKYHCTGHTFLCKGKCTTCGYSCNTVASRMEKAEYSCVTNDTSDYIKRKMIPYRATKTVRVDEQCQCGSKRDSNS